MGLSAYLSWGVVVDTKDYHLKMVVDMDTGMSEEAGMAVKKLFKNQAEYIMNNNIDKQLRINISDSNFE